MTDADGNYESTTYKNDGSMEYTYESIDGESYTTSTDGEGIETTEREEVDENGDSFGKEEWMDDDGTMYEEVMYDDGRYEMNIIYPDGSTEKHWVDEEGIQRSEGTDEDGEAIAQTYEEYYEVDG